MCLNFDGKMVNVHNSHNKSKHIAVIIQAVHGQNKQEWILAIPETRSGTGKAEAEVVIEELKQWGIKNQIKVIFYPATHEYIS